MSETKTIQHRGIFPGLYLACGFAAYYLRYGNEWRGNEIRLAYNVLFGSLNLIGWCFEWLFAAGQQVFIPISILFGALGAIFFFLWLARLGPWKGHNYRR